MNGTKIYGAAGIVSAKTGPSAPAGLTAAAQSSSSIKLSWNASAETEGYVVYRATSESGPWTALKSLDGSTQTMTSVSLKSGTTYYYKVVGYFTVNGTKIYGAAGIVSAKTK